MNRDEHLRAEDELRAAAIEYDDAFASGDPRKPSGRREEAHRRLCAAARAYGRAAFARSRA